uniref:ATPase H+ transporting accessory protein 1 n=1 Tax=Salarias fasciatus TaxID=181472 RepID=A0A672HA14_SALFA
MSAKEVLSGNDEVIGQVLSIMRTQAVPYTAVYTALRPSRVMLAAVAPGCRQVSGAVCGRVAVLALSAAFRVQEGERTCILLWARGLTVGILRGGRWEDHDLTPATFGEGVSPRLQGSSCNESIARFTMSQRFYRVSARRWFQMDAVELDYDGTRATFNGSRSVYAPAEYSFRCESVSSSRWPLLVPRSAKDPANQWRVSFRDFQVQGFSLRVAEFSYASDCAGFFSPGVWMGLLTGLLLLLLLLYGLHMVLQLRTMDRFDDPKGPAISVPQTE